MPLKIVRDNIVHMQTDAIVNAANKTLTPEGGVCGSIFDKAGYDDMLSSCKQIGVCKTGSAVITEGFKLRAKYVIHAVGPVWKGGNYGEESLLRSCYQAALKLAEERDFESISFPLISSGSCGYPRDKAFNIAVSEITQFLMNSDMTVYIVVYDSESFKLSGKLFLPISSFIDDKYVEMRETYPHLAPQRRTYGFVDQEKACAHPAPNCERKLEDVMSQIGETFSQSLLRLIDEKGKTDVEVYKKANVDRRLFSKIRSSKYYKPSKETAVALAIALELSLDETKDLLNKAGFTLSHSCRFDVIIEFFVNNKNYNVFEINEALFDFNEKLLGV